MRECGLKPSAALFAISGLVVTPRAGVWIETELLTELKEKYKVTPRAGVWIETARTILTFILQAVTPRAGVWIETLKNLGA